VGCQLPNLALSGFLHLSTETDVWRVSHCSFHDIILISFSFSLLDLWTTRCTRCPAALDALNERATALKNDAKIAFVSICCDKCDGAREIIERDDECKWEELDGHYFMAHADKEYLKEYLGFRAVPYYVVVNAENKTILHKGNKLQWDEKVAPQIKGASQTVIDAALASKSVPSSKLQEEGLASPTTVSATVTTQTVDASGDQAFVVEDLDF